MAAVTVIKLTGENHRDIDQVAQQIKSICDSGGVAPRTHPLAHPPPCGARPPSTRR